MDNIQDRLSGAIHSLQQVDREKAQRERQAYEAQIALPTLLSAGATFLALKKAVDELTRLAPKDNDVLIEAFNLSITEVRYIEPHSFLFSGFDQDEHHSFVVAHFSQLAVRVVYRPKRGDSRTITGFSKIA